jgi:hypothetical protein
MENPQQQMPQGQPQPGQEQAQQGQPQAGGQDQQMQQIMQLVQQLMQQGAQPVDAAAELLSKQVPPEMIMQVFVQMGMPEQDAQAAIQQAMEGGQQPQGPGEEQMEGEASNPQEEMVEEGAPEEGGQPSPAEEMQMRYGGRMPRQLRRFDNGGDNAEMQGVMQKVQEMMQGGADAQQVMQEIQAAAQQGKISPETASAVMEQLSGMQQAQNPQGSDEIMAGQSQDPQAMDPNMPAPDQQMGMAKFGGNLKQLLNRAYGGNAAEPNMDSKTYAQDRTTMFVNAVKNNAFKSTLNDDFPSLGGNQMTYGGGIPKAEFGLDMALKDLNITKAQYDDPSDKTFKGRVDDYVKYENERVKGNEKTKTPLGEAGKSYQFDPATNSFKVAEQAYDPNKNYQYDLATKQFKAVDQNQQGYGTTNPVGYQNPMNQGLYGNLYAGASPLARLLAGSGNRYGDPRITGANLPGGMSGAQFLGAAGQNGLTSGMTGTIGDQTWRIGAGEKFKEGSIWKGNRRKGVRYEIDWGNAAAMNPAGNAPGYTPNAAAPGYSGYNADANGNAIPDYMQESTGTSSWNRLSTDNPTALATQPSNANTADQNLINPASTDVINPSSEVNQVAPEQFPSLISNSNEISSQEATDFQKSQAEKGLEWNGQNWAPNKQMRDVATMLDPNATKLQDVSGIANATASGTTNYADSNPRSSAPDQVVTATVDNSQASQSITPEQKFQMDADNAVSLAKEEAEKQKRRKAYGGPISQEALSSAIDLINRAFGGNMPKAEFGNMGNQGYIEQSNSKKLNIDWNAAGDTYMNTAAGVTDIANKMNEYNPEKEQAAYSALNRASNTYDQSKQGLYDQQGSFIPNDIGNQVLNPTDVNYLNQNQIFRYGGKVYEIGGDVDLEDDEMEELAAAGFKFSKV